MKFKLTLLVILLSSISIYCQTPEKMSFQAVIRDGSGDLVSNSSVGMRISILKSSNTGSVVQDSPVMQYFKVAINIIFGFMLVLAILYLVTGKSFGL